MTSSGGQRASSANGKSGWQIMRSTLECSLKLPIPSTIDLSGLLYMEDKVPGVKALSFVDDVVRLVD